MKMTKIYTKTGDKGTTSLVGGVRVSKADIRLDAYGTIDELNSFIGLLISVMKDAEHEELLRFVQHKLFSLGSYLATDLEKTTFPVESHISVENVQRLEQAIDEINASLPSLAGFIACRFYPSGRELSGFRLSCLSYGLSSGRTSDSGLGGKSFL